ncbi:MAG: MFS transporter [Bacteroidales bacterium]|nr:MFS transporter [Bacteroidales bacterium]
MANEQNKGFYKLSWLQRIGFGSGDLAQNLIFQVTCTYLTFFYTDIYGLDPLAVTLMLTVGNVANVIWDPIVGALIDKNNPKLGKYRSYLLYVGIPLSIFAILCFYDGFKPSLVYAYITYISMTLLYTFINVPYGALNSSLTRDTNEITILTSVRMFMANVGGLAVNSGLPLVIGLFAVTKTAELPKESHAWFLTMTLYAIIGLALLVFCFSQCKERVVMDAKESENVKISDLWMEFVKNRPLRIIAFFFITAFAMMSIGNAAGAYFINSNLHGTAAELSIFMALGSIPSFIFMPLVPAIKKAIGKKNMFYAFLSCAIVGMAMLYVIAKMETPSMTWVYIAQFIKSTGVIVATGYMWALVPEVISYGEWKSGKRIAGIVNALTGIFFKAGMTLGGIVTPAVLAYVAYNSETIDQSPLAEEGILWLVCVIPAALLALAMFIISKYELTDDKIDAINKEIEARAK